MKLEDLTLYLALIAEDIAKLELRLEGVKRIAQQIVTDGGDNGMIVSGLRDSLNSIKEDVDFICDTISNDN